jgi:hypothetical protein
MSPPGSSHANRHSDLDSLPVGAENTAHRSELDFDTERQAWRASGGDPLGGVLRRHSLVRVTGRNDADLAIEVLMLRHEMAVL